MSPVAPRRTLANSNASGSVRASVSSDQPFMVCSPSRVWPLRITVTSCNEKTLFFLLPGEYQSDGYVVHGSAAPQPYPDRRAPAVVAVYL